MSKNDPRITLAITGASGAPYALRLLECLVAQGQQVMVLISSAAKVVFATEENIQFPSGTERTAEFLRERLRQKGIKLTDNQLQVFGKEEWFSPVASGS
ncbi:MAG TPA: flavoprotein, partial [Aliidiomarina sp.]|nr:flavoprotein [Aliidiomarina sp.]